MIPIADADESILQPCAHRALHLEAALLAPESKGFIVSLRHEENLKRLVCPASTDSVVTIRPAESPPWDDITEACYRGPFCDKLNEHFDDAFGWREMRS